jgi:hypothetical protein
MNCAFSSFGVGGTAGDYPAVGVLFYEKRERTRSRIEKVAMAKTHPYDVRELSANEADSRDESRGRSGERAPVVEAAREQLVFGKGL